MFYSRRVVDIPDGKPKWTGLNEKSELMGDDSTPEAKKRKREHKEDSEE